VAPIISFRPKDTPLKDIGYHLQILIATQHSIMNTIGRTYIFGSETNKYALTIAITKARELQLSI
jgi:hypothetical protein